MGGVKQIKIKLEKHELKVFRFGRRRRSFCEICQAETPHLTVSHQATVLNISEMNVFRLAESGQIHSTETPDGKLMICVDSVPAFT